MANNKDIKVGTTIVKTIDLTPTKKNLSTSVSEFTYTGEIKIRFSEPITVPDNVTSIGSDVLDVTLIKYSSKNLTLTSWRVSLIS